MEKTFDLLKCVRQARELVTRQEADAWILATIAEIEKAMEEKAEPAEAAAEACMVPNMLVKSSEST